MLLCCNPPSTWRNWTLGRRVVAVCVGAVWRCIDHRGVVAKGMSGKGRGTWSLGVVFVIRGALPGMLFHVLCECVCFVNCRARLVVGLGANMMGGALVIRASMESCGSMLFAGSPSSSVTLCTGTICLGTLCLLGETYDALCRSPCGWIHLCLGCVRLHLGSWSCPAANFFATRVST